jgi:hypothetical protein
MKHTITIEKEVVNIDGTACGTIAYGYANKQEAIGAIFQENKEMPEIENMEKVYVFKYQKDGEDYFQVGRECPCCGSKKGVLSYVDLG